MHKNLSLQEVKKKVLSNEVDLYTSGNKVSFGEWVFGIGLDLEEMEFAQRVTQYKTYWKWIEKVALKNCKRNLNENSGSIVQIHIEDFKMLPLFLKKKLKVNNTNPKNQ